MTIAKYAQQKNTLPFFAHLLSNDPVTYISKAFASSSFLARELVTEPFACGLGRAHNRAYQASSRLKN